MIPILSTHPIYISITLPSIGLLGVSKKVTIYHTEYRNTHNFNVGSGKIYFKVRTTHRAL